MTDTNPPSNEQLVRDLYQTLAGHHVGRGCKGRESACFISVDCLLLSAAKAIEQLIPPDETDGDDAVRFGEHAIDWPREVTAILERVPGAIRVREGGGPENLAMSLAVTVAKLASHVHKP